MNKLISILVFWLLATCCLEAETLQAEQIVPEFYRFLMQDENPSPKNEHDFFGGKECESERLLLSAQTDSETPIWDWLRKNRELFVTSNLKSTADFNPHISSPFTVTRFRQKTKTGQTHVLAMFASTRVGTYTVDGLSTVVFVLGKECYIEIGGTITKADSTILYKHLYEDLNPDRRSLRE